ncbi:hypothetical protein FA13DRAFT_1803378 [Coprinellus micaceus]|uniref:Uncharacterized protein n=1 Tax=Coprinellus micaceus TaxID=71717 RepID=A0A4Y7SCD5_COPMI|nr:hypothetical protein FA13DRAFT_1803378 [Coprinellus micaceus]
MLKALRDAKDGVLSILRVTQKRINGRFNKVIADVESFDRHQSSSKDESDCSSTDDSEPSSNSEDSDDDGSGHRKGEHRPATHFGPSDVVPAGNPPRVFFPPVHQRQNPAQDAQILRHGNSEAGPVAKADT